MAKEETNNHVEDPQVNNDLKTQLEAEKADRDRLIAEAVKPFQEQLATLGEALKAKDTELAKFATMGETLKSAVAEFKTVLMASNPLYTEELITGATIEELKASAVKADAIIAKVREGVINGGNAEAAAARIPAGAPGRKEPDISSMSTVEKIQHGLEQARKKGK